MEYEKKYEAQIIGQAIGKEIGKVLEYNSRNDNGKEHREWNEFRYKKLFYFINISVIISYIAGALVMQLPFIDKFGVMSYDFKLYLLFGTVVFVVIQSALFISSIYEQLVSEISSALQYWIMDKVKNYELKGLDTAIRIVIFIPVSLNIIKFFGNWLVNVSPEHYKNIISILVLFFTIYIPLSLLSQDKRFAKDMNTNNFVLIIISLSISLYSGRASFEEYLLTDAKITNNHTEKSIELLLIDNKAIYYKENNTYKYEILSEDTVIEFTTKSN